jgi:NADPH-dependent 2,4-dienoyl-CoA reductase/sulfur reductase-like enzyme
LSANNGQPGTVVVGASAAGLTTVEGLRGAGFDGRIVLIGDEAHLPYDRPPLSKKQLTEAPGAPVHLRDRAGILELDVELELGCRAVTLDRGSREVHLADGRAIAFDDLVIATGVRPRELHQGHDLGGVHTLRTLDDASRIRTALREDPRVVVVGGGFLGAEVASSVRSLGLDVTWLFPEEEPMADVLGPEVGGVFAARHRNEGVVIESGVMVDRLTGSSGEVTAVECKDGSAYLADLVVVCIGSMPNTEWLDSSGLRLTNGVDCDQFCRAGAGIHAAGDVASWIHPATGKRVRVEHRMNASEQAQLVAHNIASGSQRAFAPIPYFWTDQYDARLQVYGFPGLSDSFTVTEGTMAERKFAGVWTSRGDVVAVGGVGLPRAVRDLRSKLA